MFVFCLFVFCLFFFVRHATMLGTESLDGAYTHETWGGTGISPPDKSPPGQKTPRQKPPLWTKALPDKNPPQPKVPRAKDIRSPGGGTVSVFVIVFVFVLVFIPSGDIFYCSGSRQLNHSSLICGLGNKKGIWPVKVMLQQFSIVYC